MRRQRAAPAPAAAVPNTIVATVVAGAPLPYVRVDVTMDITNVVGWTLTRLADAPPLDLFYGTSGRATVTVLDYLAPFGVPVSYQLTINYADHHILTLASNAVVLAVVSGCYLTTPATGATLAVTLMTWPNRTRHERQTVLEVTGRADPVVLSDVPTWPAGRWTFFTESDEDTADLIALLTAPGSIAALRTPDGYSVPDVTVAIGAIVENRRSNNRFDQSRTVDADIQEIAPLPATGLPTAGTLDGLNQLVPTTLYDLSQYRATLLQLAQVITPPPRSST